MRFFSQSARTLTREQRIKLLKSEKHISLKRKCELLDVNRSGLYYKKQAPQDDDQLIKEIQEIYLEHPFLGYRKIHALLVRSGFKINKKKVQRLMQENNLRAVIPKRYRAPGSKPHKIYPYLLNDIDIVHSNHVWQVDITYIRIGCGMIYLICLIDVYSRKVMGWNLSTLLDTDSCIRALQNALKNGIPIIVNSDQGVQFTSELWISTLSALGIKISMDGKGRWADNIYVERLWRTIKYELFYLYRFNTVQEARLAVMRYIVFYNTKRPHQSLNYQVPEFVHQQHMKGESEVKILKIFLPFTGVAKTSANFIQIVS